MNPVFNKSHVFFYFSIVEYAFNTKYTSNERNLYWSSRREWLISKTKVIVWFQTNWKQLTEYNNSFSSTISFIWSISAQMHFLLEQKSVGIDFEIFIDQKIQLSFLENTNNAIEKNLFLHRTFEQWIIQNFYFFNKFYWQFSRHLKRKAYRLVVPMSRYVLLILRVG